jgi:hypothetical protein
MVGFWYGQIALMTAAIMCVATLVYSITLSERLVQLPGLAGGRRKT